MKPCLIALAAAVAACAASLPAVAAEASACSDFDTYVNGAWKAATPIPESRSRIGSFDGLRMANDRLLEAALAELVAEPARQTSPGLKLLARYHASGMDTAAIDRRGLAPLAPLLQRIGALQREQLPALLAELARHAVAAPLSVGVAADARDATKHALYVSQDGLGLPDRDDYPKTDEATLAIKAAYRVFAAALLRAADAQAGAPAASDAQIAARVDALLAFEAQLAEASMTRVQRRDPNAIYNPHTVAELQARAPGLDWRGLLAAYTGRADGHPVILGQPAFATAVARLAQDAPLPAWRDYLRVRLLDAVGPHGPTWLADAHFAYRSGAIRGLKAPPPRVEQVILAIGGGFGSAPLAQTLGELYVAKAFSPLAQRRALQMVEDIREGMRQRVKASPWMTPATQALALAKLEAMATKIGAPERWRSYDGLELAADDYLGNLLRVSAWATADRLPDLARPVDRSRWNTSPHIVNAFAAGGNQIVFPAGILQPPFFDANADDATNYGAIGMVIGHEITHHFDDRGRQFDAVGNLRDWWTPADAAAYKARADRVVALYEGYEPLPGQRINGRQMLGENLSDVGGMQIAFAGLQIALKRQRDAGRPAPLIDGQTPEQRFFTATAVVWRAKDRPEALLNQLRTGQHSPARFRILGPMSQMESFAKAFGCKPGDAMVAAEPIVVW